MFDLSKTNTRFCENVLHTFSFAWDQSMKVDHFEIRCGLCTITRYMITVK